MPIIFDPNAIEPCKCGNIPKVGIKFWYKSKYGAKIIGVIKTIHDTKSIISTNGAQYPNREIEVRPKEIVREEKLNTLGI
jgi:hypothetical protein